jgi:hypothetical protein
MLKQASCPGASKHSEVGLAAAVDLCRGAAFASGEDLEEIPLRLLAVDIAHEMKVSSPYLPSFPTHNISLERTQPNISKNPR